MPKAPPIDSRTYDDIVAQTEKLAYQLSGWTPAGRGLLRALPEQLRGQILDEDLGGAALVALRGAPIDAALAQRVAAIVQGRTVQVRTWLNAYMPALVGETLDEDVIAVDGTTAAASGTPIDAALARSISARRRAPQVRLTAAPDPATLAGLTLDEDIDDPLAGARRGTLIDSGLAQRLSAALHGATLKVLAAPKDMAGRAGLTLREDVCQPTIVAARDTLIDKQHASAIAQARPGSKVRVRPAAAPDQIAPPTTVVIDVATLIKQVLDEDVLLVLDEDVLRVDRIASSGAAVDDALAGQIVAAIVPGPVRVLRQIAADPSRLLPASPELPLSTLGQDIIDTTVAIPRGTLLDLAAARQASALRLPRDTWVRVQASPDAGLAYAVLQETIVDAGGVLVAPQGATISSQLAERISALRSASSTAVHISVPPMPEWLNGAILDETIVDSDGSVLASSGAQPDEDLTKRISALRLAGLPAAAPDTATSHAAQGLVWVQSAHPAATDDGGALIRIFGRMMEGSIARLNQALDKQRLAFLNMVGAEMLPPQPALAALTFQLAPGSTSAFVPAGTRVLSQAGASPVGFETDQDLVLTAAQLMAALACDIPAGLFHDYTAQATGAVDAPFPAFAGDQPIEHSLYLANDDLFALPGSRTATITFIALNGEPTVQAAAWSYWDGASWQHLEVETDMEIVYDGYLSLSVNIGSLPAIAPLAVNGRTAAWIRAQAPLGVDLSAAVVRQIYATVTTTSGATTPLQAFANSTPIDLSKDFYPFGERPVFNDTLYLPIDARYALPDVTIFIDVTLTNPAGGAGAPIPAVVANQAHVQWEVCCGGAWLPLTLGTSPPKSTPQARMADIPNTHETTRAFTQSGTVWFTLPDTAPSQVTVGGVAGHWMRARLISGDYNVDGSSVQSSSTTTSSTTTQTTPPSTTPSSETTAQTTATTTYVLDSATFAPPAISLLRISYVLKRFDALAACLACNDGVYADYTELVHTPLMGWSAPLDGRSDERSPAWALPSSDPSAPAMRPFTRMVGPPALYLGFDRPFPNLPAALFLEVEPALADEPVGASAANPPPVAWAYATADDPSGWAPLAAVDETRGLTQRGTLRFIGPADAAPRAQFGQTLYWLRASWLRPDGMPAQAGPQLRRVLTNTAWATAATTVAGESLGPSDGSAGQTFRTRQAPVLPGQQIEVFEREISPDERAALIASEGADAITPVRDAAGHTTGAWVRWHAVPDFYASGPRDRHYQFDAITGQVRFGDGYAGLIPPPSREGVRAALYRVGGGVSGNCPAGTITRLAAALPLVQSVVNLAPATSGAEAETVERATERAPRAIRHGGRAVAAQDYEDLALAASPAAARALAIPAGFAYGQRWIDAQAQPASPGAIAALARARAGQVGLILVPQSADPRPTPSVELAEQVRAFVQARCPPTARLWIGAPGWDRVMVTAEVAPVSLAAAENLERSVLDALRAFLHPLTGGAGGQGWPFGRMPYLSDIYALLEAIPGVDHVGSLGIDDALEGSDLPPGAHHLRDLPAELRARFLIYSGNHSVILTAPRQGG